MKKKKKVAASRGSSNDFSDKAVLVMLGLVVLFSLISIVFYFSVMPNSVTEKVYQGSQVQGAVSLEIIEPPEQIENRNLTGGEDLSG